MQTPFLTLLTWIADLILFVVAFVVSWLVWAVVIGAVWTSHWFPITLAAILTGIFAVWVVSGFMRDVARVLVDAFGRS